MSGWLKVALHQKVVWKSVKTTSGERCVMMDGTIWMQELYADNWDILLQVLCMKIRLYIYIQQVPLYHYSPFPNDHNNAFQLSETSVFHSLLWSFHYSNSFYLLAMYVSEKGCSYIQCCWLYTYQQKLCFTVVSTIRSLFGLGFGQIALNNVECSGTEARLLDCLSTLGRVCHSGELAGVQCYMPTGTYVRKHVSLSFISHLIIFYRLQSR